MEEIIKYIMGAIAVSSVIAALTFRHKRNQKQRQVKVEIEKNLQLERAYEQLKINYNKLQQEHSATKALLAENQKINKDFTEMEKQIKLMKKIEDERFGRLIRLLNAKGIHLTQEELNNLTP